MRRVLSVGLFVAVLAAVPISLWLWKTPLAERVSSWAIVEEDGWVEKPAVRVVVRLSGADLTTLEPISKKIASLLTPFDGHLQKTPHDSPAPGIDLTATIPPAAVLPLRDLTQKMTEAEAPAVPIARKRGSTKRVRRRAATGMVRVQNPQLKEVRRRRDILMKTWVEAEKVHFKVAENRRDFRHPEILLKGDEEAQELKRRLIDLEMTLAEVIDHYTPAHPRVRDLQQEVAALRSGLDRRVLVAETEEQTRWERRLAEFQQKKRALDREEKRLISLGATTAAEPITPDEIAPGAQPEIPLPTVQMSWSETETQIRELVKAKRMDAPKIAMGISAVTAAGLLLGYLLGWASTGSPKPPPSGEEPGAGPAPLRTVSDTAVKVRKPLPPIESAPVPPAPEKIIEEKDLPGVPWISMPVLPQVEKGLYTVFAPTSASADLFSKTAESFLARLSKTGGPQVVAAASVRSGAGTSTFLANLAAALSTRRPVLLIDLHHTAPSLHTFFSIPASSRDLTSSSPWTDSVAAAPVEGLSLLPLFSPHLEKEMSDLNVKKRLPPFLKENPPHRIVLIDVAPLGRSDLFEEVAEVSDLFILILGPEATPATAKQALKRLDKAMKKKIILRVSRTDQALPGALTAHPSADFEFA